MHTRRDFLRATTLYSAGILAGPALSSFRPAAGQVYGLQLYTVRDFMAKDPAGTLAKVARIGYNSLEGATYNSGDEKFYGMDARTFAGMLKNNGLVMRSCHYRYGEDSKGAILTNGVFNGTILHDWDRAVEDAHALGLQYMICAWLSESERGSLDHYKKMAHDFNIAGEKCKKAGIQFCHHNHDFEFTAQGGKYPYDVLLSDTDPHLVKMELDLYWASFAGQDPVKIFEAHPGRFPLWHLKDMDKTERRSTEFGKGKVDLLKLLKNAKKSGMKHYFVEQEEYTVNAWDSMEYDFKWLNDNA